MNTSNKLATSIFRARDALNVAVAGSSETLVSTYQTAASHPRGQIFVARDSYKSHIYI
jgi:hypothetical protein